MFCISGAKIAVFHLTNKLFAIFLTQLSSLYNLYPITYNLCIFSPQPSAISPQPSPLSHHPSHISHLSFQFSTLNFQLSTPLSHSTQTEDFLRDTCATYVWALCRGDTAIRENDPATILEHALLCLHRNRTQLLLYRHDNGYSVPSNGYMSISPASVPSCQSTINRGLHH